jgi:hypothetical protein
MYISSCKAARGGIRCARRMDAQRERRDLESKHSSVASGGSAAERQPHPASLQLSHLKSPLHTAATDVLMINAAPTAHPPTPTRTCMHATPHTTQRGEDTLRMTRL